MQGFFSCITCGALCFVAAAITRPSEMAAHKLVSVNYGNIEDYPKFKAEAKLMADDLGADHIWSNIDFRTATKADRESFNSGLNSEGSIQWNSDWTVKLGVNLLYSAELTHSLIYSKQIPDATPKNLSRSQTKRKNMADIEPTTSGKSPQAEELAEAADHAAKRKCIIVYERRKKLKEKVIQQETPEHERDQDQGAKQFELSSVKKRSRKVDRAPDFGKDLENSLPRGRCS